MASQIVEVKVIEAKRGVSWVRTETGGFVVGGTPSAGETLDKSAVLFEEADPMKATSRFYEEHLLASETADSVRPNPPAKAKRLWLNRQNMRIAWLVVQVVVVIALVIVVGGFLLQALF